MNRPIRYFSQCTSMIVALLLISGLISNRREALAQAPTTHEIDFINDCTQPIWIAASGGPDVMPTNGWELAPSCDAAIPTTCPGPGSICVNSQCSCTAAAASDPTNCAGAACIPNPLLPGKFYCKTRDSMMVPAASYRIWGRTGCTGSGANLKCNTGDCAGKLDCVVTGGSPPVSLFELTVAPVNGVDSYDVSLVDGYSLPLTVKSVIPTDTPGWTPSTTYHNGQGGFPQSVITASAGSYSWNFNETGSAVTATSANIVPKFVPFLGSTVQDTSGSNDIVWSTTTATCQSGICNYATNAPDPFLTACPAQLMVTDPSLMCTTPSDCPRQAPCSGGHCAIACDAPSDYCGKNSSDAVCNSPQNNSFFQCLNLVGTAQKDIRGKAINLQSPGAGSEFCLNAADCKAGTKCVFTPTFTPASNVPTFPANLGVCAPGNGFSPQDGGCPGDGSKDGQTCPGAPGAIFPFPSYTCATLTNAGGGSIEMCLPPVNTKSTPGDFGYVVWNADNFTPTSTACTSDTGCSANQFCLEKTVRQHFTGPVLDAQAVNECLGTSDPAGCVCNNIKTCTNDNDCHQSQCHDKNEKEYPAGTMCPDSLGPCICQTDAVYTGICGPMNQNWVDAYNQFQNSSSGDNYISVSKNNCPTAYSFQFDDQAGNFACRNTSDQLVGYNVDFCGTVGRKP